MDIPAHPSEKEVEEVYEHVWQSIGDSEIESLAELPAPLREVVVLRHYEGLSFEEMARLLGTPATTLKSRFAVALRKLHETLTARGLCPEDAP